MQKEQNLREMETKMWNSSMHQTGIQKIVLYLLS